jgi:hypothetical protein
MGRNDDALAQIADDIEEVNMDDRLPHRGGAGSTIADLTTQQAREVGRARQRAKDREALPSISSC